MSSEGQCHILTGKLEDTPTLLRLAAGNLEKFDTGIGWSDEQAVEAYAVFLVSIRQLQAVTESLSAQLIRHGIVIEQIEYGEGGHDDTRNDWSRHGS